METSHSSIEYSAVCYSCSTPCTMEMKGMNPAMLLVFRDRLSMFMLILSVDWYFMLSSMLMVESKQSANLSNKNVLIIKNIWSWYDMSVARNLSSKTRRHADVYTSFCFGCPTNNSKCTTLPYFSSIPLDCQRLGSNKCKWQEVNMWHKFMTLH